MAIFILSGCRKSDPGLIHPMDVRYHYATARFNLFLMYEFYNECMKIAKGRNGIRYPEVFREKARQLRATGKTHREIAKELVLSLQQQREIQERRHLHQWTIEEKNNAGHRLKKLWLPIKYTRKDLLRRITDFYSQNGRIPLKREFNSFEVFKNEFGSWNNAIIAAGFDPNPILFAKKFIAGDGHRCDSFSLVWRACRSDTMRG